MKLLSVVSAVGALGLFFAVGVFAQPVKDTRASKKVEFIITDFGKSTKEEMDAGAEGLISAHHELQDGIIRQLKSTKDPSAQLRLVYIVGAMRIGNAIPELIPMIEMEAADPDVALRPMRWSSRPVRDALVSIGRESAPYLVAAISTEVKGVRRELLVETLQRIVGTEESVFLIERASEANPANKPRLDEAVKLLRK